MSLSIRNASSADAALILHFIRQLAIYEKAEDQVEATPETLAASLFGPGSPARALVCEQDGQAIGFAVYFFNYSTWQAKKGLYLEDLFVLPAARGHGAGKRLLQHLAGIAVAEGCGRFEWSVLDWNQPAIDFYQSIGAKPQSEWVRYRMHGQALRDFAAGPGRVNSSPGRDPLPDTLRAIAMLSVLVVNAIGYAVAPWGPMLGVRMPSDSAWSAVTQGLVGALLQGKGVAMLSFVFGMSLWLAARRRGRPEALQRGLVRNRRLLGLGIVHGVFVYFGDILTLYALVGRRLLRRLHQPWRGLRRNLWHALAWALLAKLAWLLVLVGFGADPDTADVPSIASVQGGWPFLQLNASSYAIGLAVSLPLAVPVTYLCMACGVAAARLRLLTHRRWRAPLRRFLWRCGPPLAALGCVYGWGCAAVGAADAWRPWIDALGDFIALPLAACYLAALALAANGGRARWCRWFSPLGQRTLSLYIGHSLLCLALLSGAGLAIAASPAQTVLACLGLWLLALAAAAHSRRPWPLEAWMARR